MTSNKKATIAQKELSTEELLERTCLTALLGEDSFYENGESLKDRVTSYFTKDDLTEDAARRIMLSAKNDSNLRHMPIFLALHMMKKGWLKADDLKIIFTRPDDLAEALSLYWGLEGNKHSIPKVLQKGMSEALHSFDAYQLSKYLLSGRSVKLRDVLRLAHAKPADDKESALWKSVIDGTLKRDENTWEVALSGCKTDEEKRDAWVNLLQTKTQHGGNKLGTLALLRNMRNMYGVNVPESIIRDALENASMRRILPFQVVTAASYAPSLNDVLEKKLTESMANFDKLPGDTVFLVDVSGSMDWSLGQRSDTSRIDVAATVATIVDAVCERSIIYTFNEKPTLLPSGRHGFALIDQIRSSVHGGTNVYSSTNQAIKEYTTRNGGKQPARVIVITDEQDNRNEEHFMQLFSSCRGYIVNVAGYETGVGYQKGSSFVHISGWSENIVKFISEYEKKF